MEEFGIWSNDGDVTWNNREMTSEVTLEFLSRDQPHAAALRAMFPSLDAIERLDITINRTLSIWLDGHAEILIWSSDKYDSIKIELLLSFGIGDSFIVNSSRAVDDGGLLLNYLNDFGHLKIYNRLREFDAQAAKITALEETIEQQRVKIAALEADIAERRLRPGGEDYEEARARFTMQAYE